MAAMLLVAAFLAVLRADSTREACAVSVLRTVLRSLARLFFVEVIAALRRIGGGSSGVSAAHVRTRVYVGPAGE